MDPRALPKLPLVVPLVHPGREQEAGGLLTGWPGAVALEAWKVSDVIEGRIGGDAIVTYLALVRTGGGAALADLRGVAPRSLRRHLGELETAGWVRREGRVAVPIPDRGRVGQPVQSGHHMAALDSPHPVSDSAQRPRGGRMGGHEMAAMSPSVDAPPAADAPQPAGLFPSLASVEPDTQSGHVVSGVMAIPPVFNVSIHHQRKVGGHQASGALDVKVAWLLENYPHGHADSGKIRKPSRKLVRQHLGPALGRANGDWSRFEAAVVGEIQAAERDRNGGKFNPDLARWLKDDLWEEPPVFSGAPAAAQVQRKADDARRETEREVERMEQLLREAGSEAQMDRVRQNLTRLKGKLG